MNKAVLSGNLTREPEVKTLPSGVTVCTFTLAVGRKFKNANGEKETDFIPIVAWRQQAEAASKYLHKGSKAAVSGSIQTRNYEAQDGTKRYVTEIIADEVEFLDSRNAAEQSTVSRVAGALGIPADMVEVATEPVLPF